MIYDILEEKLTSAGFTPGENLFRNFMPADVEVGVMTRSPLTGININPTIPGWYRTKIQIITRHRDVVAGLDMATKVAKVLNVEFIETHPATAERGEAHISLFYPDTLPIQFPQLDGNGYEISQHFTTAFGFVALETNFQF